MSDLFHDEPAQTETLPKTAPLADKLRPAQLSEVIGQEHLTGPEGAIGRMVAAGKLSSMILWGPPGVGKSAIVAQLAAERGLQLVDIRAPLLDPTDLRGIPAVVGDRAEWFAPSFLPREGAAPSAVRTPNSCSRCVTS